MVEKKQEFVLADLLKDMSNSDTGKQNQLKLEYIDIDLIDADPHNRKIGRIRELAENIALIGLQQPLAIRPDTETDGRYIVVSGHRRRAALKMLVDEGDEQYRMVPCMVGRLGESAAMMRFRLLSGNAVSQALTPDELAKVAADMQQCIYDLKAEGYEFPGKVRDYVANALQVSGSKLARLKLIREKLVPSAYVKLWEAGKMPEQTAYAIARMEPMMQEELAKACPKKLPDGYIAEVIQRKGMEAYLTREQKCPDGEPCTNGARILSRDAHVDSSWRVGQCTCCAICSDNMTCQYACPQGKAAGEKRRARKKAEEAKREAESEAKDAKAREVIAAFARRVAAVAGTKERLEQAIEAANEKSTQVGARFSYGGYLSQAAFGREIPHIWYSYYFPESVALALLCRELGCSADYLLGLSDKPLLEMGRADDQ